MTFEQAACQKCESPLISRLFCFSCNALQPFESEIDLFEVMGISIDFEINSEELEERYREIAGRRIRLGLLLSETGRMNNLTVSQEDLNRAMAEQAQRFPGQEQQVLQFYQENPQSMQELQAPLFEEKVVDYILELAKVTERKVTVEELLADLDEDVVEGKAKTKKAGRKKASKKGKAKTKGK